MIYLEFKRHLGKAGLSIDRFAALLGVRPSSVSNHARRPEVPTSYAVMAILLGDAKDRGVDCLSLLAEFGVKPVIRADGNLTRIENYRERKSKRNNT